MQQQQKKNDLAFPILNCWEIINSSQFRPSWSVTSTYYSQSRSFYRHLFLVILFPERSCPISTTLCALCVPGIVPLTPDTLTGLTVTESPLIGFSPQNFLKFCCLGMAPLCRRSYK